MNSLSAREQKKEEIKKSRAGSIKNSFYCFSFRFCLARFFSSSIIR